jgi:hypothetical protein
MMTQEQVFVRYGDPGDWSNMVDCVTPYSQIIAWDQGTVLNKFKCHKKIKDNLDNVFCELLEYYGLEELQRLEIDLFGGCYNFRKMRGGNKWSRHSWAIAIDLNPAKNGLRTKAPKAQFSGAEYIPLMDIFYDNNFINYGVEKGYDWMHFEIKD